MYENQYFFDKISKNQADIFSDNLFIRIFFSIYNQWVQIVFTVKRILQSLVKERS